MYYSKIELGLSENIDLTTLKDDLKFSFGRGRLNYYSTNDSSVFSHIIDRIPANYDLSIVEILGDVEPHVDSGVISCINFYVQAGHYKTNWWVPKIGTKRTSSMKTVNGELIPHEISYNLNDLNLVDSFVAADNETYILNISKIHSVNKIRIPTTTRIMVQFSWQDLPYEELYKFLKEKENETYN